MKLVILALGLTLAVPAFAQKPSVYPAHGQSMERQMNDDGACYGWARQNTGIDPTMLAMQTVPPPVPVGGRAVGAARGAAAGAVVGELGHNNVGHAAAVGATVGAVAGGARQRGRYVAEAEMAQGAKMSQIDTYWRAYGACMEGRGYTVR
ncbi:hypothetical protein [Pandoraea fibrosis]|uniref:Uncharacterized protein n=1 Tax=Pandoraea fibrosis TaxID=1891094 RepID=A0A5E4R9Y4_9BURK|nr:hypothetical protein [Pandoraea fibrosis]QHE93023.1 hypothetical protein PJ20_015220 [Pandoraea fibrosis]QHF13419.1 hypothetical protein PI93_012780 [Pandoraea fibrosis]VVD59342.1 hypothetical protein PFI31113_00017 [Pandoraea fibrosis]